MRNLIIGISVLVILAISSCGSDALFNQSIDIPNRTWKEKDVKTFKVDISDAAKVYDFVLTIRTTTDYQFANLWLYLTIDGPMGKSKRFPIEIITADPTGRWTGDKSGSLVSFSKLFMHDRFTKKGKYSLHFEQATTQKTLSEVVDITLDVYPMKSAN